ncbi:hypothetical protein F7725_014232 [Dissostichus mawsoni]|uniref:Uncharacterized protein n=1 Tax=Dissostichus mawsoni TaxID=36200 RepID=A0A7J5YVB8_DISMA|nr:hypothetical protein F7725_014232 [Dissostichus mawsoni]
MNCQHNNLAPRILMEETAETGQSYLKEEKSITETGFQPDAGHLYQESDKAQEKSDDERAISGEAETVSQTEIEAEVTDWKDTKEADPLFKEEKPETEDEPLQRCVSPDEIKHIESGRSQSGSEASSSGEEIVMTESGSQGDTCTEPHFDGQRLKLNHYLGQMKWRWRNSGWQSMKI